MTLKRREGGGSIQTPPIKWKFSVDTPYKNIRFSRPPYTIFGFSRPHTKILDFREPLYKHTIEFDFRDPLTKCSARETYTPPVQNCLLATPIHQLFDPYNVCPFSIKKQYFRPKQSFGEKNPSYKIVSLWPPYYIKSDPLQLLLRPTTKILIFETPHTKWIYRCYPPPLPNCICIPLHWGKPWNRQWMSNAEAVVMYGLHMPLV